MDFEMSRLEQLRLRNEADPYISKEFPDPTQHEEYLVVKRERLGEWVRRYINDEADPPGFDIPDFEEDPRVLLSEAQIEALVVEAAHEAGEELNSRPAPADPLSDGVEADGVSAAPEPSGEAPPTAPEGR